MITTVPLGTTPQSICKPKPDEYGDIFIQNNSGVSIYVVGTKVSSTDGIIVIAGGTYTNDWVEEELFIVAASGSGNDIRVDIQYHKKGIL